MLDVIKNWYRDYFTDPQAVILLLLLLAAFGLIVLFGNIMAPVLVAMYGATQEMLHEIA